MLQAKGFCAGKHFSLLQALPSPHQATSPHRATPYRTVPHHIDHYNPEICRTTPRNAAQNRSHAKDLSVRSVLPHPAASTELLPPPQPTYSRTYPPRAHRNSIFIHIRWYRPLASPTHSRVHVSTSMHIYTLCACPPTFCTHAPISAPIPTQNQPPKPEHLPLKPHPSTQIRVPPPTSIRKH